MMLFYNKLILYLTSIFAILVLTSNVRAYPTSRDNRIKHAQNDCSPNPSDDIPLDQFVINIDEEPRGANPIGRYFLYQRYKNDWQNWAHTLGQLYKNELKKSGIHIEEGEAHDLIFASVDAKLADSLVNHTNSNTSKKAAKEHYEMNNPGARSGLNVASLMEMSMGGSSSTSRSKKGKGYK